MEQRKNTSSPATTSQRPVPLHVAPPLQPHVNRDNIAAASWVIAPRSPELTPTDVSEIEDLLAAMLAARLLSHKNPPNSTIVLTHDASTAYNNGRPTTQAVIPDVTDRTPAEPVV